MQIYTIYKATCISNGKSYIGFDSHWPDRVKTHVSAAKNGSNFLFHKAIRKHGVEGFEWCVLYQSKDRDHTLKNMEAHFIDECESFFGFGSGYNMTLGGEGSFGAIRSVETREKLSRGRRGKKMSEEAKGKIADANRGRACSPETRAKISESQIGKAVSHETRAKLSEINKGKPSPTLGKPASEETRAKLSAAKRGKKRTPFSPETRAKMSAARQNISAETRERLSIAAREAHMRRRMNEVAHVERL